MIVVTHKTGQMCNRIILYAHAFATALDSNQNIVHLNFSELSSKFEFKNQSIKVFNVPSNILIILLNKLKNKYRLIFRLDSFKYYQKFEKQLPYLLKKQYESKHQIHIIDTWYYRNYEALYKYKKNVLECFKIKDMYIKNSQSKIRELKENYDIIIAIHKRQGDYKNWVNGKFYYSDEQYTKLVQELSHSFSECKNSFAFVIFSNVPTRSDFCSELSNVFISHGNAIEDLYFISECDYIIGPPSTFSWWAAFSGDKKYCVVKDVNMKISLDDFSTEYGKEYNSITQGVNIKFEG